MDNNPMTQPISTVTPDEINALERIVDLLEELVDQGRIREDASFCASCGGYHE